ncbi:MAG: carbamoyl phosphate synthase small subunit [Clostridiales bacterium]|nr:carbamoyl phosphate synthase small subunit [Clostridiales bacterium]
MKATLILENGAVFEGESIGSTEDVVCEMVFNTSMVGYQEILTDPSYAGQGVVMTYPLIGNYGTNDEDDESEHPWAEALVIRHLAPRGSNFRCTSTLNDYLIRHGITGIQDIDTRALTRILRIQGVMNGVITCEENYDLDALMERMHAYRVQGTVERVSCKEITHIPGDGPRIALYDFGEKRNMANRLLHYGCDLTIYPAHTPAETVLAEGYDGIMLSNGPGDPADCVDIIPQVRKLYESGIPIFAVCLGHQLMALATGARSRKMRFGHRGANHPVKDLARNRCYITSQNHGYVIEAESVDPEIAEISHINVNDGSLEGLRYRQKPVFTVQFHPEASPGPVDTDYLFRSFLDVVEQRMKEAE